MKILQMDVLCGAGSTGRIVTDLAKSLEANGHDCLVCFGRGEPRQWDKTYKISNKWDTRYHALMTRLGDRCGFHSTKSTKRLIKVIKEYDPDIIHLQDIHGYYVNIKILFGFLKSFGKPVIWTQHDCWAFTGHCAHFDLIGCDKWRTQCHKCPQKKEYPKSILFDRSKKNYREKKALFTSIEKIVLVTPSKWLADLVGQSFLGKYPIRVINNGIDTNVFRPIESDFRKKFGLENKKIILGVASNWSVRKGLNDFIKLSALLIDEERVVLVGLNDKQIKSLPTNIIGIKKTYNANELAEIYSAADVFVNPTYEDNYPTTNLEAQACGTNVITYKTGGSVESVDPENVCEQGNVEMLYEMIKEKTCKSKKVITDIEKFSKGKMMSEYMKLYKELHNGGLF